MAPPAKRRRRNSREASRSEDEHDHRAAARVNTLENFLQSSPTSSSPRQTNPNSAPRSPVSPTKARSSAVQVQSPSKNGGSPARRTRRTQPQRKAAVPKTADLKTLFSKQAQRGDRRTPIPVSAFDAPSHDLISSDDDDDDEIAEAKVGSSSSLVGQHARKRLKKSESQPAAAAVTAPSASQMFLRPSRTPVAQAQAQAPVAVAAAPSSREPLDEDLRPWSERFGPKNLEELAVHKKKVADVRKWLEDVMGGRLRQGLLVLKGAAGSGKTTTVRLLASDLGCELLEWKNPGGNAGTGFVSASAQFDEFLGRGRKFGALDLEDPESRPPSSSCGSKKIILIEEFPNTFSRASTALASFRQSLLQHVASRSNMPPPTVFKHKQIKQQQPSEPITPVVLVISETLLTTTSASADSLTAHRLLGPDILGHPGVGVVEFNVIAPTLLAKALELVVQKESRKSGRRRTPGPLVLKKLGEIGDIRSAISSLEFLCLKGDLDADWGARVTFTRQKKGVKDAIALTRGEKDSLEMVSRREASLGIFHAVGKVVYNKREDGRPASSEGFAAEAEERLPAFLAHCSRPKRSEVSVEALMDETGTDTHTFVSALHENYALSCESTDPMDLSTSMDYVNDCIDYLSQCDLLCPSSRDVFFGSRGGGGGGGGGGGYSGANSSWDAASQLLRQDEMMFQVAVRGMLFSLPNPVRRQSQSRSQGPHRGGDAFKMFYPASLKLWRAREEIEGMVDVWTAKLLRGEIQIHPEEAMPGTMEGPGSQGGKAASIQGMGSLGDAGRREMLLDRLPYMAHMARSRKTRHLRDLEKMVSFRGVSVPINDDDDDDENDGGDGEGRGGDSWATDKPSEEKSLRRRAGIRAGSVTALAQKLVLSDDDIEDYD